MAKRQNEEIFQLKFSACCDSLVFVCFLFVVVVVFNCDCNVMPLSSDVYKPESRDCAIKSFEVCMFEC